MSHAGKGHDRNMHGTVEQDVFVDLIGNRQAIELLAESRDVH